jgi:hypothetical protein
MAELKRNFIKAKMNKDSDERVIPPGEYRHALNIQVHTSDTGDVGALQNIAGNTKLSNVTGDNTYTPHADDICVGIISHVSTDKIYYLIHSNGGDVKKDYILEYSPLTNKITYVFVDIYSVKKTGLSGTASTFPVTAAEAKTIRPGMKFEVANVTYTVTKVDASALTVTLDGNVVLPNPLILNHRKVLEFPDSGLITGINVLDDNLFWTDNATEPKRINIPRSIRGTGGASAISATLPLGENADYHTRFVRVKTGTSSVLEIIDYTDSGTDFPRFMALQDITVIRKPPLQALNVDAYNTVDERLAPVSGYVNSEVIWAGSHPIGSIIEDLVFTFPVDFRIGDIVGFTASSGTTTDSGAYDIKTVVTASPGVGAFTSGYEFEVLTISPDLISTINDWTIELTVKDTFLDDKFARFSYRYKYQDGEYSTFAPWSEVAFIPARYSYSAKEGYNEGMVNSIRRLTLKNYVPVNLPYGVTDIDLLYKETNNPTVYTIETVKPVDTTYEMLTDMVHALVPSDQLLRPWDNVPRIALAQEVSANRIIYGNYLQNYNVVQEPVTEISIVSKDIDPVVGMGGLSSVKTLRQYQAGVVFSDEYGRETPVLTSSSSSVAAPVELASKANSLKVRLNKLTTPPSWAKYYSFYIKEPTVEYNTLAMDRWYNAADGNIWISFPSSERNKLDEETFLYLKKAHGNNIAVTSGVEYKILAIENEAPNFIKLLYREVSSVVNNESQIGTEDGGYPLMGSRVISIPLDELAMIEEYADYAVGAPGIISDDFISKSWRLRFSDTNAPSGTLSRFYDVDKVTTSNSKVLFHLHGSIGNDLAFATTPGAPNTFANSITTLKIHVFSGAPKSRPEFDGRFFVKIAKDLDVTNYITSFEGDDWLVFDSQELAYINNNCYTSTISSQPKSYVSSGVWYDTPNLNHPTEHANALGGGSIYAWSDSSGILGTDVTSDTNEALNGANNANTSTFWGENANRFFIDRCSAYSWSGRNHHLPGNFYDGAYANGYWDLGYEASASAESSLDEFEDPGYLSGVSAGNWNWPEVGEVHERTAWMTNAEDDGSKGMAIPGRGIFNSGGKGYMDISWSGFSGTNNGMDNFTWADVTYSLGDVEANQATRLAYDPSFNGSVNSPNDFIEKLYRPAAKFRFKLDPDNTVYTVQANWQIGSGVSEHYTNINEINIGPENGIYGSGYSSSMYRHGHYGIRNYKTSNSEGQWDGGNLRQKWSIQVTPQFGSGPSGYAPTTGTQNTGGGISSTRALHHDGTGIYDAIEILVPTTLDEDGNDISGGYVSNPAVWETKPKESVDIDIYYQASDIIPIGITPQTNEDLIPTDSTFKRGAVTHTVTGWDKLTLSVDEALVGNLTDEWIDVTTPSGRISRFKFNGTDTQSLVTIVNSDIVYTRHTLPWNNCWSFGNGVESDRVRDDYNAPQMDNGVKASTVLGEQVKEERRKHGLIWSGIYNSTSGINETNQFAAALKITKDLNPVYGSVQALVNRDSKTQGLALFCEDKVLRAVTNKDALYNADGNPQLVASNAVVGDVTPYAGDWGISKNPESLAVSPSTAYFTDVNRGKVLALSTEGVRPISDAGMTGYFFNLKNVIEPGNIVLGTFDDRAKEYNLSTKHFNTVSFNEGSKSWVSFKSFLPTVGVSLNNDYYTFAGGDLWKHHDNALYNNFYGNQSKSNVTTMFGDTKGSVKSFNSVSYEGSQARVTEFNDKDSVLMLNGVWSTGDGITNTSSVTDGEYFNLTAKNGWYMSSIKTDLQTGGATEFKEKEGKWFGVPSGDHTVSSTANFSTQGLGVATATYIGSEGGTVEITVTDSSTGSDGASWD